MILLLEYHFKKRAWGTCVLSKALHFCMFGSVFGFTGDYVAKFIT